MQKVQLYSADGVVNLRERREGGVGGGREEWEEGGREGGVG